MQIGLLVLLMIDNYDSFTFNLVHYFQTLGQEVRVYRNDQITIDEIAALAPDYIVISPGPKEPNDAGISLQVIAHFIGKIPLLGVCLGHQCIAQHFGAKIVKAKHLMHGKTSVINHLAQGLFNNVEMPMQVTRYHSLVVEAATLPAELMVSAWTTNGQGEMDDIMALQHKYLPVVSVQFHPESILTARGMELLKNFIFLYSNE
jgi:anthranilate synthase/aminodeoxychorismate synthase-like glutamine amidotransferase